MIPLIPGILLSNKIIRLLISCTVVLTAVLLYFSLDARVVKNVFPPCPFHALTGFYCPGCGSQRAFSALVHGELISALHYNLLMVACLPLLFYSAFVFVLNSLRRKELVQKIFYSVSFVRWLFVVVVLFWIARNIPVQPFALLAPHA